MTTNNFASDSILYYPTIEFQDETWVKAAITFWDKIYRIVPIDYKPKDSDEVKIAISEGIIENIILSEKDLADTAINFEKFCDTLDWYPAGFDSETYAVRLSADKIDERLKPYFDEFAGAIDREGFYSIRHEIANGYMFFLSDSISKNRNIGKLTDNPDMFSAMSYFDGNGKFGEWLGNPESKELYTNAIIENLLPADIRSIRMDKIIKLGDDLKSQKTHFRNLVADFSGKFSKIEDKDFALKELSKFKKSLTESQLSRNEILKGFSQNLTSSVLYAGFPAFTSSMIGSVFTSSNDILDLVEIFKGFLIAGVATMVDAGRNVKNWDSKKSNYYLDIRKNLDSKENAKITYRNMNYLMEEYIND